MYNLNIEQKKINFGYLIFSMQFYKLYSGICYRDIRSIFE